jgi:hypothetical protein
VSTLYASKGEKKKKEKKNSRKGPEILQVWLTSQSKFACLKLQWWWEWKWRLKSDMG